MRTTDGQNNFTRGEVTPLVHGRTDQDVYKSSLVTATNCEIVVHGPIKRRGGTRYISEVKDSNNKVKLIQYEYTANQSFLLEFGHLYIRFFLNKEQILSGGSPYEIASPFTSSEIQDIQWEQYGDTLYITHINHLPQKLVRTSNTSWTISSMNAYPEPTYEAGYKNATITCTPGATSGTGINFTFSSNVLLAADLGRQIVNLQGTGRAAITAVVSPTVAVVTILENFPNTSAIPANRWLLDLSPLSTLTPSGSRSGQIIDLSSSLAAFRGDEVGKYILFNGGVVEITEVPSNTLARGEVQKPFTVSGASDIWTLESPAWNSTRGYPRTVTKFEQRLFFGGTLAQPVTIWGSASGDQENFGVGTLDGDSVEFDLTRGSSISWMLSGRELIIGGDAVESTVSSSSAGPLTPSTITQKARTTLGSNPHKAINVPNEAVFIQKSESKLRSLSYNFDVDSYLAEDVSLLSEHIYSEGIREIAFAKNPYPIIYSVLDSGDIASLTYSKNPIVIGTSLITTDGEFEQVCPVQSGGSDDVYIVVKRDINGTTKRYIEVFEKEDGTDILDIYSDCSIVYSNPKFITGITLANPGVVTTSTAHGYSNGDIVTIKYAEGMTEVNNLTFTVANATATTFQLQGVDTSTYSVYTSSGEVHKKILTISGLSHLEGKTVQVKSDGATHPNCTVSSGSITLQELTAEATIGLPYVTTIKTLPKEFNIGQGQTMIGQRSRWPKPILKLFKSALPTLNGQFVPNRSALDSMDAPVPLFSDDIEYGSTAWDNNGQLEIVLEDPYPLILIGVFGTIEGGVR